jgi:hypothetical protein
MKTKIYLLAILVCTIFTYQNLNGQVKLGIHEGINIGTQSELGQLWDNNKIYSGLLAGVSAEYQIGNSLSLQTEINFQQKGARYDVSSEGIEKTKIRKFDYITVPLLVKGIFGEKLGLQGNWKATGFAGPYVSYLTTANISVKAGDNTLTTNIENNVENNDWGVVFGGGVLYNLGNGGAITTELRYEMGLGKIEKMNSDLRNKIIGLTIGYRF